MSSTQTPLRAGVIGLGYGGEMHLKGYTQLPNVEVIALAGLEETRLHALGETYSVPNLYRYDRDLLARNDLDIVSICVPNHLHMPIAVQALEKGAHVLCEKPLARTTAEAEVMVQAARRANRVLQTVYNHRLRGDVLVLKQLIDEGQLGHIYYARATWMRGHGIPGVGTWFVNKDIAGGGPLIDLGVHVLDMALYLLDEPEIVTVSASTYNELGTRGIGIDPKARKTGTSNTFNVEDIATAFLRLGNGATLLLEAAWATHGSATDDFGLTLYGTEGGAELRVHEHNWQDTLHVYRSIAGIPAEIRPQTSKGEGHIAVVRNFVQTITSGNWSLHDGSEGMRRVQVVDSCYESAKQGREIVM